MAEAAGVTRQTINAVERGRYEPSLELALKLAAYFDCPVEELFWLPEADGPVTATDGDGGDG